MFANSRPLVSAGVAIVGASAIAISPVAAPPPAVWAEAVSLSAATTDWADVFSRASDNATALFDSWRAAPAPILQQILANQAQYLTELPNVAGIIAQIQTNFQAALNAPLAPDPSTLDTTHRTFYELLPAVEQLPGIPDLLQLSISPTGKQLLAFSTTALSGVLLGMAGPVLGPLLVLASSFESIRNDLSAPTPDMTSAMSTLAGIPAAMTDAFLNGGQHVDVTALAKEFGPAIGVSFPDGVEVGVALGGLLSPGGSIFNALDFAYDNDLLGVLHIHVPLATGTPVGPIGAMMEFARTIAKAIGADSVSSSAAAQTPAKSTAVQDGLAAANEVPRSVSRSELATVTTPITPKAENRRDVKVDSGVRAGMRSVSGHATANRAAATPRSGKASSARGKRSAKATAGSSSG